MPQPWDPDRYLTYADERGRPFVELLTRVAARAPKSVVDLGCGPGNLTALLSRRWPNAAIVGVDSSPAMIKRAKANAGEIDFQLGDVREWQGEADVVVSNATLQWVPDHLDLIGRLAARAGEWFAFQVPGNFAEPSHVLREELANQEPYAVYTKDLHTPRSHDPAVYYEALAGDGWDLDVWETTYLHVLPGEDAVFDWISGTSLLPTRAALPAELFAQFSEELKRRLRVAYPASGGKALLPFRRIFVAAHRQAGR